MRTEENAREATNIALGLEDGDWVTILLNHPRAVYGFFARVVEVDDRFVRVVAHSDVYTTWESRPDGECMALEMIVPWSAISWVAHAKVKPLSCKCLDA